MPEIGEIRIQNFRGAKAVTIDFRNRLQHPVITLVGLNESGKTTILEALSNFTTRDATLDQMMSSPGRRRDFLSLLPIDLKPAFTGSVAIRASISLSDDDKDELVAEYAKHNLVLDRASISDAFDISVDYLFQDSAYTEKGSGTFWNGITWSYRTKTATKFRKLSWGTEQEKSRWLIAINYIRDKLPQVVYFPTFLVDLPKKIYLEPHPNETSTNSYYRTIISNVVGQLPNKINLEDHVVKRIKAYKTKDGTPNWFARLLGTPEKGLVDSVFNKASGLVTKRVLDAWRDVIGGAINIDKITLGWGIDDGKGELPYATFSASDGEASYELDERSLGFRWFFSFLLFTTFGGAASKRKLFLFDEPAANLHVKAQSQLLRSFKYLVSRGDNIVYSTHSAHMIEVEWLSGAYIVENDAIDYERDVGVADFTVVPTNIRVTPYRRFVDRYPNRTSYFQPIAEKLQHSSPAVAPDRPALIVEGPSDFYALSYAGAQGKRKLPFDIIPAESADKCGPLIGWYLGRGLNFVVMLDDDSAGSQAKARYISTWSLAPSQVVTLGDLDPALKGKTIEGTLSPATRSQIAAHFGQVAGSSLTKKLIAAYFAEAAALGKKGWLSADTEKTLADLLKSAQKNLGL